MDGGPDDVAGRGEVAADDGPDLAGREQEAGVIERALGGLGGLFERPALGFALLEEEADKLVAARIGQRVDDGDAADIEAVVPGDRLDRGGRADEAGLGDVLFPEDQGRLEGPDVFGVGEGDLEELFRGLVADVGDEWAAHGWLLFYGG